MPGRWPGNSSPNFPQDVNVQVAQATAQLGSGDTKSALFELQARVISSPPGSIPVLTRYVALLNSEKQYREARSVLADAVAPRPEERAAKG